MAHNCTCLHCRLVEAFNDWRTEEESTGSPPSVFEVGKFLGSFGVFVNEIIGDEAGTKRDFLQGQLVGVARAQQAQANEARKGMH